MDATFELFTPPERMWQNPEYGVLRLILAYTRYRTKHSAVDGDDAAKIWQQFKPSLHTYSQFDCGAQIPPSNIHPYRCHRQMTRFHIVHTTHSTYLNECKMYECAWRASSASDMSFATFMRNIRYVIAENDTSTNGNRQPIQRRT